VEWSELNELEGEVAMGDQYPESGARKNQEPAPAGKEHVHNDAWWQAAEACDEDSTAWRMSAQLSPRKIVLLMREACLAQMRSARAGQTIDIRKLLASARLTLRDRETALNLSKPQRDD